jgi:hypothetical protein
MDAVEPFLKGHWIVGYDPSRLDYRRVLEILAGTDWLSLPAADEPTTIRVHLTGAGGNLFFRRGKKL